MVAICLDGRVTGWISSAKRAPRVQSQPGSTTPSRDARGVGMAAGWTFYRLWQHRSWADAGVGLRHHN